MPNKSPAGFGHRFVASFLEGSFLLPLNIIFFFQFGNATTLPQATSVLITYLTLVVMPYLLLIPLLTAVTTHYFGTTLGKFITGIGVSDSEGKNLTLGRSLFRHTLGYQFSWLFFGLGYLAIFKDPQKQAWHDKTVGSYVWIKKPLWPLALFLLIVVLGTNVYILSQTVSQVMAGPLPQEMQKLISVLQEDLKKTQDNPTNHSKDEYNKLPEEI